ncbi:MAG: hypothetical protein JWO06_3815, partial [Bacteroidota bacterium]|nr:hypothetical protein [Bacteroidota bacterium]
GCSVSTSYTLNQPTPIVIDTVIITEATCQAGGCIVIVAHGGTGQLIYHWSNGANGDSICGLSGGNYLLTITDQNGCQIVTSYTVTAAAGTVVFGADTITNILCFGDSTGSIHISASGGTGVIHYHWSYRNATTSSISNLTAGIYTVTITDSVGCSATMSYAVTQPSQIVIDTVYTTQATCQAGGCIKITSSGGTGIITYRWPSGATTDSLCGLAGGPITVTATDQNGCTVARTFTITAAPGVIVFDSSRVDSVTCHGGSNGSITIYTSGGTGTVHYHWSYQNDSTTTITGLPAGTYTVTASDGNGCSVTSSFVVGEPPLLTATINYTPILCFLATDGNATVTAAGGSPGYTYRWNINNQTTDSISNLSQGGITVTVTDSKGCTVTASANIAQRAQITSTVIARPFPCHTPAYGNATITTGGGVAPLTFTVPGYGSVIVSEIGNDTAAHFDSLPPGQYPVIITDSVGCTANNIIVVPPSASDSITEANTPTTCFGANDGSITITVYDLQNGPFGFSLDGGPFQTSNVFDNVTGGIHTVTVSNSYGCAKTFTDTVIQPQAGYITPNPDTVRTTIETATPLIVTPNNFTNPVYTWTPADGLSCTDCSTPSATVSGPTVYYVTVSDSLNKNCAAVDTVVVLVDGQFHMPSAFTPNGDGKNDFFGPVSFSYATVKSFRIYNRWGELVHNSNTPWDGKLDGKDQPAGTYLYYIVADHYDQYDYTKIVTEKQEGSVTLLR